MVERVCAITEWFEGRKGGLSQGIRGHNHCIDQFLLPCWYRESIGPCMYVPVRKWMEEDEFVHTELTSLSFFVSIGDIPPLF